MKSHTSAERFNGKETATVQNKSHFHPSCLGRMTNTWSWTASIVESLRIIRKEESETVSTSTS